MDMVWEFLWPTSVNQLAESDLIETLVTIALLFGLVFTGSEGLPALDPLHNIGQRKLRRDRQ